MIAYLYVNDCIFICQWLHIYDLLNLYFWRFHLEIALVICLNTWSLVNFSVVTRYLPREVDPLVYNMSMEDPGDINYNQVGGLGEQVRELREVIELPLINPELFQVSDNIHWQGVWSEWHGQNARIWNATDLFVWGLGEDFLYLGWFQAMAFCHWSFVEIPVWSRDKMPTTKYWTRAGKHNVLLNAVAIRIGFVVFKWKAFCNHLWCYSCRPGLWH